MDTSSPAPALSHKESMSQAAGTPLASFPEEGDVGNPPTGRSRAAAREEQPTYRVSEKKCVLKTLEV